MDNPTIDVREGEYLDLAAVDACLRQHIDDLDGRPKQRQYASGSRTRNPGRRAGTQYSTVIFASTM